MTGAFVASVSSVAPIALINSTSCCREARAFAISLPLRRTKPRSASSAPTRFSSSGSGTVEPPIDEGLGKSLVEVYEASAFPASDDADKGDKVDLDSSIENVGMIEHPEQLSFWGGKEKARTVEEDDNYRFKMQHGREIFEEKVYLVGVKCKSNDNSYFSIEESLKELEQLADTAGLMVVGSTHQTLSAPNPKTYIGSGKVAEIKAAVHALDVETVIFDDELSRGQLRNLEKALGGGVRICDRTALILDIFNQRAVTREAALQVSLAQLEYQLPRLTKMWSHLERQAGGQVKGMGEKQIEVDKRLLRAQITSLKKELESVRKHRRHYRNRRSSVPVPVVSLVGYTNAGKSTLLNCVTGADVLAEDQLFATLDPVTRRVHTKSGKEFLLTDTVGFIQKLPTTLVAAFRATLEEISDSSLVVHVVDISHPLAQLQMDTVDKVLSELDVSHIPKLIVYNKVDKVVDANSVKMDAQKQGIVCISALNSHGINDFLDAVQDKLKDFLVTVEACIPYDKGDLLSSIHEDGIVEHIGYADNGTLIKARVPLPLARILSPLRQQVAANG